MALLGGGQAQPASHRRLAMLNAWNQHVEWPAMANRRFFYFAWLSMPTGLRARCIWWVGPAATAGVCKTPTRKQREFESRTHHTCGHGGTGIRAALRMLSHRDQGSSPCVRTWSRPWAMASSHSRSCLTA